MPVRIQKFKKGQIVHGWRVQGVSRIKDLKIELVELEHIRTKAKYIHIANDSRENAFAVAFKTIPSDSTGVAHILEHTVLTGSEKYPVRDPFFSMLKRSMSTFMNAFTGNDWTAYPFATQNRKDYYNLLSVYLDAAFFPVLSELNFKQEGIRLEYAPEGLRYKGIVFNEMKGCLSSPERIMEESLAKSLFPASCYRFNSGGDPKAIALLTHAQMVAFHQKFYHPSNSYFYSYGDLPLAERLAFIEENVMRRFSRQAIDSEVKPEPRWNEARKFSCPFPLGAEENAEKKYQAALAWVLCKTEEAKETLVLELLEDILLDSPSAPLRNALITSGLGSDLSDGSGLDTDFRQLVFSAGLKDIRKADAKKVEAIIMETLEKIVKDGLDKEIVAASVQKLEFSHKEVSNTPYPYGLKLWLRLLFPYLHGGRAAEALNFSQDIADLKRELDKPGFLEGRIRKYLIANRHRASILLEPDRKMQDRLERDEKSGLEKIEKKLSADQKRKIISDTKALKDLQEKQEDLAVLPSLGLADVPRRISPVKSDKALSKRHSVAYSAATNGLFYLSTVFPINPLPDEDLLLLPLFCYLLPQMGTRTKDYLELSRAINSSCGGINYNAHAFPDLQTGKTKIIVTGSSKCLSKNIKKTSDIYAEIIQEPDFSSLPSLHRFISEYIASLESGMIDNGYQIAASLSAQNLSYSRYLHEIWYGVSQLRGIKEMAKNLDQAKLQAIAGKLERIATYVFGSIPTCVFIGEAKDIAATESLAAKLARKQIIRTTGPDQNNISQTKKALQFIGIALPTSVSFIGLSFRVPGIGHPDAPALFVLAKLIGRQFFHAEIREKGGAYGGIARYDYTEGIFSFGSYRDPHIIPTLEIFSRAKSFILKKEYSRENINEAILQIISDLDRPGSPHEEASAAFGRKLAGLSEKERTSFRQRILEMSDTDLKRVAQEYLRNDWKKHDVAIMSNREKLAQAEKKSCKKMDIFTV